MSLTEFRGVRFFLNTEAQRTQRERERERDLVKSKKPYFVTLEAP